MVYKYLPMNAHFADELKYCWVAWEREVGFAGLSRLLLIENVGLTDRVKQENHTRVLGVR